MAVTAPVSLSKIVTEFGGAGVFSSYVRGGTYVPNSSANAAISTTAAGLAMSQFVGALKESFALTNATYIGSVTSETNPTPPPAIIRTTGYSRFTLKNDGTLFWETANDNGTGMGITAYNNGYVTGQWMLGATASDFEVQVVVTGTALSAGSATSGSGVWNNLGTNRLYTRSTTVITTTTTACAVTIRRVVGGATVATATITLNLN